MTATGSTASGTTTHLTVSDSDGNVVSYTFTIESTGGNGMVVPGYGFLLNNELTDFNFSSTTHPNRVEGGKRPRSSMSPTIVLRDGEPFLAVGSPGGSTIITTVLQILVDRVGSRGDPAGGDRRCPRHAARHVGDAGGSRLPRHPGGGGAGPHAATCWRRPVRSAPPPASSSSTTGGCSPPPNPSAAAAAARWSSSPSSGRRLTSSAERIRHPGRGGEHERTEAFDPLVVKAASGYEMLIEPTGTPPPRSPRPPLRHRLVLAAVANPPP